MHPLSISSIFRACDISSAIYHQRDCAHAARICDERILPAPPGPHASSAPCPRWCAPRPIYIVIFILYSNYTPLYQAMAQHEFPALAVERALPLTVCASSSTARTAPINIFLNDISARYLCEECIPPLRPLRARRWRRARARGGRAGGGGGAPVAVPLLALLQQPALLRLRLVPLLRARAPQLPVVAPCGVMSCEM